MPSSSRTSVVLAPYTTMRVGGPAASFAEVETADELVELVGEADRAHTPLFVLGGGSNVVVGDDGFAGQVIHTRGTAIEALSSEPNEDGRIRVRVGVGTPWDAVVAWAVEHGLGGIEALSGVPGQIGSAVMQNLGAYGQEVGTHLESVRLLDRADGSVRQWDASELQLGYRTSLLRDSMDGALERPWGPSPRWIVLDATFALEPSNTSVVHHAQLAQALGCPVGATMPLAEIRNAVLDVRSAKGMVGDEDAGNTPRYDCWSSGSFFTNPVLTNEEADRLLPDDAPRYAGTQPGTVKTSAAWLIEHAGFAKGFGLHGADSRATLSTLHTLALTNRGHAQAADIVELARAVQAGVYERFGVHLEPESVLVGITL